MSTRLRSIKLSDFRGFGTNTEIILPEGAGVTILSGANGLGKSTVLEAFEWVLTGDILRLSHVAQGALNPSVLLRRGAPIKNGVSEFSAELEFMRPNGQVSVLRRKCQKKSGKVTEVTSPSDMEIRDLLINQPWPVQKSELGTYLHLTHLQSQSSSTRFSGLNPKDQWQRLRGPAGLNQLSTAQERIGNTTRAFNEELDRRKKELEHLKNELNAWKELLKTRDLLKARMIASEAISPTMAIGEIEKVLKEINFKIEMHPRQEQALEWILQNEHQLKILLNTLEAKLLHLKSLESIPADIRKVEADIEVEKKLKEEVRHLREHGNETLKKYAVMLDGYKNQIDPILQNIGKANDKLLAYEEAIKYFNQIDEMERKEKKLHLTLNELLEKVKISEAKISELEAVLGLRRSMSSRMTANLTFLTELEALSKRVSDYRKMETDWQTRLAARSELLISQRQMQELIRSLDNNIDSKTVAITSQSRSLDFAKLQSDEVINALSKIISHVKETDHACPVCSTEFLPEQLKERINKTSESLSIRLVPLEKEITDLKTAVEKLKLERAKLGIDYSAVENQIREIEIFEETKNVTLSELSKHPTLSGITLDKMPETLASLYAKHDVEQSQWINELNKLPAESDLNKIISENKEQLAQLSKSSVSTKDELDQSRLILARNNAAISSLVSRLGELSDKSSIPSLSAKLIQESESNKKTASEIEMKIQDTSKLKSEAELWQREQESRALQIDKNLQSLAEKHKYLATQWQQQFAGAAVSETETIKFTTSVEKTINGIRISQEKISAVKVRLEKWDENIDLKNIEGQISQTLVDNKQQSESKELSRREQAAELGALEIKKCEEVHLGVQWLRDKLETETKRYTKEVLAPLNELQDKYLLALTDNRRWRIRNDAHITSRSGQFNTVIDWTDKVAGEAESNANQILSEGQMAAVTLAQLLAMSTAYRWSKWQGLLLDAPTQHNDLIHATSLIELMRNLVLYRDYQIVLCTHDMEEADFVKRKLRASKINVIEYRLLAHSANGVEMIKRT